MQVTKIIQYGQKKILEKNIIRRKTTDIKDFWDIGKIISILGARRTGKTHLMIQYIKDMIRDQKISIEQVVFIDFAELSNNKIDLIEISEYYENINIKPVFALDEIQELEDFEKTLVYIYNKGYKCIITGSNSKMLSQDISTKLRGRTIEIYNDILDFEEYITFKKTIGVDIPKELAFQDYLDWGGYPEIVLTDNSIAKKSLLQSYIDVMIYKDLIDRYKIQNQEILQLLIKYLILAATKPININKLYNGFKSQGYSLSKNTLYEYMQYLQNIYFIKPLNNFYKKSYFNKIYIIDNGFINLYGEEKNYGQKLEQIVYKNLYKKYQNELGFTDDKYDIDFVNETNNRQVCYDLNFENQAREIKFAESSKQNHLIYIYNNTKQLAPNIKYQNIIEFLSNN